MEHDKEFSLLLNFRQFWKSDDGVGLLQSLAALLLVVKVALVALGVTVLGAEDFPRSRD